MKKILFDLKDIKPQLTKEQIKELEHVIYMAKERKEPQKVQIGKYSKSLIIWTSGRIMLEPEQKEICEKCGQPTR